MARSLSSYVTLEKSVHPLEPPVSSSNKGRVSVCVKGKGLDGEKACQGEGLGLGYFDSSAARKEQGQ